MRGISALRVAALAAALATFASPASAVQGTNGIWGDGGSYNSCGPGLASRLCTFTFSAYDCTEAGISGVRLLGCDAWVTFDVYVRPIMQAGRVVGCESGEVKPRFGAVGFNSNVPRYDNADIDQTFVVSVKDLFADGKPGTVTFDAAETEVQGTPVWLAEGSFFGSCAPDSGFWGRGGAGSVTVHE